jgi:phosphopantothenoylcysteine synthetase/decarboxylase
MKILLGLTGSVATTIAPKIVKAMEEVKGAEKVEVVMTEKAQMFMPWQELREKAKVMVYTEANEWTWMNLTGSGHLFQTGFRSRWQKGDPVLHIELAKEFNVLVIAPATANTIAKMTYGIVDNLLLSVYAAWRGGPVIIAPAMNTYMLDSQAVRDNIRTLERRGVIVIPPAEKTLACGDVGKGALADVEIIALMVERYGSRS